NVLFSVGFFLLGAGALWAAWAGKPFYPGTFGGRDSNRPKTPLSPGMSRIAFVILGLTGVVVGVGSFLEMTFAWPIGR
ncbi:MAG TPA: hypothetical protein VGJ18_08330, partial [Gemmatimonadaceae bacterium]